MSNSATKAEMEPPPLTPPGKASHGDLAWPLRRVRFAPRLIILLLGEPPREQEAEGARRIILVCCSPSAHCGPPAPPPSPLEAHRLHPLSLSSFVSPLLLTTLTITRQRIWNRCPSSSSAARSRPWWWSSWEWRVRRFPGTSGGLVGCGGPSSVYLSTLSLGGDARIE